MKNVSKRSYNYPSWTHFEIGHSRSSRHDYSARITPESLPHGRKHSAVITANQQVDAPKQAHYLGTANFMMFWKLFDEHKYYEMHSKLKQFAAFYHILWTLRIYMCPIQLQAAPNQTLPDHISASDAQHRAVNGNTCVMHPSFFLQSFCRAHSANFW